MASKTDSSINYSPLVDKQVSIDRFELIPFYLDKNNSLAYSKQRNVILNNFFQYVDSIEIFENMFAPGLTGQIYVRDPNALSHVLKLRGLEGIVLEFSARDINTNKPRTFGPFGFQI